MKLIIALILFFCYFFNVARRGRSLVIQKSGICEDQVGNMQECIQCAINAVPGLAFEQKRFLMFFCLEIATSALKDNSFSRRPRQNISVNHESWMEHLSPRLQNTTINLVAIPGSHDSGSYSITSSSKLDPSAKKVFRIFNNIFGKLARTVMARWSITQDLNFGLQLEAGVRYFDMRISKNIYDNNQFYFVHSLYARKVKQEFDVIKKFLSSHPKEIILLDFNHFYNMNESDHMSFVKMIIEEFKSLLVSSSKRIPTIQDIWNSKQQVIAFYHNNVAQAENNSAYLWPGFMIPSPWANTDDTKQLIQYLNKTYYSKRLPQLNLFYVSQGILTPDDSTIIRNLFSTLKKALSNKASHAFLSWLESISESTEKINVSIVDFVENFGYIDNILKLNK